MNFLKDFPGAVALLEKGTDKKLPNVNGHVHTPYSFSSFEAISQIFELAEKEDVEVIGINDFFVADGYDQFYNSAVKARKFPLFNVEFIGLIPAFQQKGITQQAYKGNKPAPKWDKAIDILEALTVEL